MIMRMRIPVILHLLFRWFIYSLLHVIDRIERALAALHSKERDRQTVPDCEQC